MCGIVGILSAKAQERRCDVAKMLDSLVHRGPDANGIWINDTIALGHTRLSIQDLSACGSQPMLSFSGRWIISFNGEIYNFKEIRQELLNSRTIKFNGNSDTEVLINAIDLWGIKKTLQKCVGMFAFAAWDKATNNLYLARDRFGEKPLYYGYIKNEFVFASELKAIESVFQQDLTINRDILATYMRYSYVPSPFSIYKNIFKLEPGCFALISQTKGLITEAFWENNITSSIGSFTGDYQEAVDMLEQKLKATLALQMNSDVSVGASLSGGIDSTTIVALMQSISKNKIKTFSIGFNDKQYNEAKYAKVIANYLGTEHTELYVSEIDAINLIPKLPYIYDEPFADSSQIPTYFVSKIAKSEVTVNLSGDAGDELFGGYNRYYLANVVKSTIMNNKCIKNAFMYTPVWALNLMGRFSNRYSTLPDKLIKLKKIVKHSQNCEYDVYKNICSLIYEPNELVLNASEIDPFQKNKGVEFSNLSYQEWMMMTDSQTYMIDDILTKVDRASMAVSLETRVPFLDHRIYEFAWTLPLNYKLDGRVGKRVLRDVLYRYVPKNLIERPKMGFGVPIGKWLKGELREWVEDLLSVKKLSQQGYLNPKKVRQYWEDHLSGKQNWQHALWNILMFQAWLAERNHR